MTGIDKDRVGYRTIGSSTQLTDNRGDDDRPAISGSNVVWEGRHGFGSEIYLMRGAPIPLPNSFPSVPALSTPAVALLAGLLTDAAVWLIRRRRIASA